jgi:hypothetical protein
MQMLCTRNNPIPTFTSFFKHFYEQNNYTLASALCAASVPDDGSTPIACTGYIGLGTAVGIQHGGPNGSDARAFPGNGVAEKPAAPVGNRL